MKLAEYKHKRSPFLSQNPFCACIYTPPTFEHSHDFFEFAFPIKGKCDCRVNGTKVPFSVGYCVLARPGDSHIYNNAPRRLGDYQHNDVYVSVKKMKELCDALSPSLYDEITLNPRPVVYTISHSLLKTANAQITLLISHKHDDSESVAALHSALVISLLSRIIEGKIYTADNKTIPEWLSTLTERLSSLDYMLMPVSKIAADIGYSAEYLSREFHKYMKITLRQFVIRKKMEFAAAVLAVNDVKIIELAQMLGYSNPSNFSKNFYDVFKCNPQSFKAEQSSSINRNLK